MGLQGFERRLEQLVEGTFGKAFPSGLQPVEIGRKVTRILDAERTVGVDGVPIAPNNLGVYLSPEDFDRFHDFADALARELAEVAREYARAEGYHFVGPVTVTLVADDELRAGECDVAAEIRPSGHGFLVADLGSMNGTVVNGATVREHVLQDGDELRIGSTTLRFEES